jgi:hypothetical protein
MFNRVKAIETLISEDIDTIVFNQATDYLDNILRFGMKGYCEMTDEELISELQDRDISYLFGETE